MLEPRPTRLETNPGLFRGQKDRINLYCGPESRIWSYCNIPKLQLRSQLGCLLVAFQEASCLGFYSYVTILFLGGFRSQESKHKHPTDE